jgi:hypothetical protein
MIMGFGRRKGRWTLGGLMVLIALVAVPMAWLAHQAREADRQRAVADALRAKLVTAIERALWDAAMLESKAAANRELVR